jgi:hypothetical protein
LQDGCQVGARWIPNIAGLDSKNALYNEVVDRKDLHTTGQSLQQTDGFTHKIVY